MSTTATTETVDTRSQAEYNGLCSQKSSKEAEASAKEAYIAELQEKLDRLDTAYANLKAAKEAIEDDWKDNVKKCYKDFNDGDYMWDGIAYDNVVTAVDTSIKWGYDFLINQADRMLDDIGDLRTEYENKILDETTILSGLWKAINSLWDSIKNYWN